jgi:hypothetical protein
LITDGFIFLLCPGDSPDHERGDGPEDESAGFQPEEHAPRSSTDESTLPPQHSQVGFITLMKGVVILSDDFSKLLLIQDSGGKKRESQSLT